MDIDKWKESIFEHPIDKIYEEDVPLANKLNH